jgi:hypothetical protein
MHRYIRLEDDIDRANGGVYSPGLRDNAQDARNQLFGMLKDIPGKDAYLRLVQLSKLHPHTHSRTWMAYHAKSKAELDADERPWSASQLREFNEELERTPRDHWELFELARSRLLDLKYDLEEGDASFATLLRRAERETEVRNFIGGWCRDRAEGRYQVPQEEELADAKKPDLRFLGNGFDAPVPVELKLAGKWSGNKLFERLEQQLCGDYLRDERSSRGVFLLVDNGERNEWVTPAGARVSFAELVEALQNHWEAISPGFPRIEEIAVVGIDLLQRNR